ncbi:hypothetical protein DSM112329_02979 [Paraconexibacter sp. AEG42_29]|uniref:Uncharacterized protein n=2 Tax=Paraconexibacter sp. AEG42_29 TaxID=2997339 RepID=A0AAU7AWV3_9ACTN
MYDQPDMRYHRFDPRWSDTERHASMSDGGGDEYSIIFSPEGTYVRGFDHESALSPWTNEPPSVFPGLTDDVPATLRRHVDEPAFIISDVPSISVCLWRERHATEWSFGVATSDVEPDTDGGATELFSTLNGDPTTYAEFATDYYEVELSIDAVEHVMQGRPLDAAVIRALNPEADVDTVLAEARDLGYPA